MNASRISILYQILLFLILVSIACADPPRQAPPKGGTWEELKSRGFTEWRILRYSYRGQIADGGSLLFRFYIEGDESFALVAAHGLYLTDDDVARGIEQSFFILVKDGDTGSKWFKVRKDSEEEVELIKKLEAALLGATGVDSYDPGILSLAISHIKSRKQLPDPFEEEGFFDQKQK